MFKFFKFKVKEIPVSYRDENCIKNFILYKFLIFKWWRKS